MAFCIAGSSGKTSVASPEAPRATAWKRKFIDFFQNDAATKPVPLPKSATSPSPKGTAPANEQPKGGTSLKQKASSSPEGTAPANQQQALPLSKGSASPKERATSASKGTTLPKQGSSLAAGKRLSFEFTPQAQPRRASAVTSASASSAAAAADSGAGSPAGATGSAFAKPGKSCSPGAGKSALTSSPEAGKSALTSSPDAGKSALTSSPDAGKSSPTSLPQAANLSAAAKSDSAKRGTDASLRQTQSDRISQAGATEPGTARGTDKAKVTTAAAAAQPAVVSGLSSSPVAPSLTDAAELVEPSSTWPTKLPAKFRFSLTDTAAAYQSDLPDSASVSARVYSPQAEAATQLPQAVLGSTKGKTVAQTEGSVKGSVEVEGEQLAGAPPLPEDEGPAVPLPPLPPAASAAAEQAAASAVPQAAAAQAPPLTPAAAEQAASAAPTAAEQGAPAAFPSYPSAAQARQTDRPSSQLPPTLGLAAKRDIGPTAKPTALAPVPVSAAQQPGPSDPRLARKRQREESRNDSLQQTSMPRKTVPSLPSGGLPSRLLPQLPRQLLGATEPGQPAARSLSSSQQSQRGPDRNPWGKPWGNPPPSGPGSNAGLPHHSHSNSSYSRPSSAFKSSRWDVSTPKQGSPAPTTSIPLSAPTGLPLPPSQPDLPSRTAAAAAVVPSHGSNRIGAVAYPAQQQQGSTATSGPFSPQSGSGNSQQAASEQAAAEWHVRNPEVSDDCQAQVVQLRYRWGKSHGEDSRVKGVLSLKARTWSAKRMGRLAAESGTPSCLVLRHDRTAVPPAYLALDFHQVFQPASAFAL